MSTLNEHFHQPPTINVEAIERELTSLWQQASKEDDEGGVTRASMFNLLVYAPTRAAAKDLDDILTDVAAARPCRVILIVADSEEPQGTLTAEVTSRCTLPSGSSKQVCCEQVTITSAVDQLEEVPSAVAPLMLSDLPVYLWWHAEPKISDKKLFRRLVDLSNRVVIDSTMFPNPESELVIMASVLTQTPRWTAISDLNWARLTAWRALLAGFYDIADYQGHLNNLSRVVVRYAPTKGSSVIPARALLLGGWLASRLQWTVKPGTARQSESSASLQLSANNASLTLEFEHTRREIEPGHLALVTLESGSDQPVSFTVRRSEDGQRIETSVTRDAEKSAQRVLGYEGLSETELIGKELEILGHDRVYEQAVLAAGEIIRSFGHK
jgi:glucose-6-phosphate dehydrogenase assembly protein OpcA